MMLSVPLPGPFLTRVEAWDKTQRCLGAVDQAAPAHMPFPDVIGLIPSTISQNKLKYVLLPAVLLSNIPSYR